MGGFQNVEFSKTHFTPHYSTPQNIERVLIHIEDLATSATIHPISNVNDIPPQLLQFLFQEYNDEVNRGDTQPFFEPLTLDEFKSYWFGQFAGLMLIGDSTQFDTTLTADDWSKRCLGSFFIKSNYPGRCSQVCTMNLLVNAGIRKRGIGFFLCECFVRWAPMLGYNNCIIEMVFDTNVAAKKVLSKCGFIKLGRIKDCAILRSTKDSLIDSFNYSRTLEIINEEQQVSRFDQILNYLISGQYPNNFSREDKGRLRSLSYSYRVNDGKLFLKEKEVISNVNDQFRITREVHGDGHHGINRTTTLITKKYHWNKVKSTVKKVITDCMICQGSLKGDAKGKMREFKVMKSQPQTHADDDDDDGRQLHHHHVDLPNVLTPLVSTDDLLRNLGMNFDEYPTTTTQPVTAGTTNVNTSRTNYTDDLDDIISDPDYNLPSHGIPSTGRLDDTVPGDESDSGNDDSDDNLPHSANQLYGITPNSNIVKRNGDHFMANNGSERKRPKQDSFFGANRQSNGTRVNPESDTDDNGAGHDGESDDDIDLSNIIMGE